VRVLAIETATAVCAAALIEDGTVRKEESLLEKHVHSEKLLTLIDAVLEGGGYDAIAVSIGPGSFTGLRIGLSVAKGLAFASGRPVVAVPTLEALVQRAVEKNLIGSDDDVIAMIDARRDDVYAAAYRISGGERVNRWGPEALALGELFGRISPNTRTVMMGDGVDKFVARGMNRTHRLTIPAPGDRQCGASSVGILGYGRAQRGEFSDIASLEPLYIRDFATLVRTQHSPS